MKIRDYLNDNEIRYFTSKNDFLAAGMLLFNWVLIFAAFALVYIWPNPLTFVVAVCIIAGRQLGLGVIMHECGHHTFFNSRRANSFFGQWFAGKPSFNDIHLYTDNHVNHHRKGGTPEDPDLTNYQAYPVSKASFKRKITRDLTGQTGLRFLLQIIKTSMAIGSEDLDQRQAAKAAWGIWLAQAALLAILALTMSPWLYLVWLAAMLTVFMLISRIRQIGEHAAVPELFHPDARRHARTTYANWLERLLIAPNCVNYHLEHHFMASVPCYRLPEFHRTLKSRGAYSDTEIFASYAAVIRHVTAPEPATGTLAP